MCTEEIEQIIQRAINDGVQFPWWLYILAVIAPFIGGFLGAYFKKKGENLATKEDYKSLLKQVKKTTVATESIKANLATGSWLHQQGWLLKEKYYSGLLDALYRLKVSISARLDHYLEPGSEHHDGPVNKCTQYKSLTQAGLQALQQIRQLHGPAEMVVSDRAIGALNRFYSANWQANHFSECNKEYLENVFASINEAHKVILEEARIELR